MAGTPQGTFTIYDSACPRQAPDTSTPARAAAVGLEDTIRRDPLETGAFIAADGTVIISKTGSPGQVQFVGAELNGTYGAVFTHNHPSNGTFSYGDVVAAIESNMQELRAVGPTIRHFLRPRNGWPTKAELAAALPKAAKVAQRIVGHMVASGALDKRFAQAEAEHQFWVEVANALGLVYRRERS